MRLHHWIFFSFLIGATAGCEPAIKITTNNYYFDPVSGNDTNTGKSPQTAFKTLAKIKTLKLLPGDSILLKSGAVFTEQLYISAKGDSLLPLVIGKYGGEVKPHIKGNADSMQAVHIFNSENIVIRDLEVSNKGDTAVDGLNGVLVELLNYGTAKNIRIDSLYVHDVYGGLVKEKKGGNAIHCVSYQDEKKDSVSSKFNGLVIQNCHIKDCRRNGIMMWGNWERKRWNPSLHVVIRNNVLEGVPGDGIVPVACESPLVEYNVMKNCPATLPVTEACDGIWPWSCDNALIQYNIVSDHKSQVDGYGFDADWNSTNSLFQYNLSYNNDGGFLLICNSGGWPPDWSIGNKGTIVRYNVSINDGLRNYKPKNSKVFFSPVIHCTGSVQNTVIDKNLFYIKKKANPATDKTLLHMTNWGKGFYPDSTFFRSNFIFAEETNLIAKLTKSTNNFFQNNLYVGDLMTPAKGFIKYNGAFDKTMWHDSKDKNWDTLIEFLKNKTILFDGTQTPVLNIIGY
jgi:hypothetical protein